MAYKYEQGRIIQIMGEMTSTPDKRAMLQVHIICDFDGVNVERYLKAISKQSLVCPRMSFRRLILDTALSPAPNVFLPSVPRAKHDEVLSKDISMDLFESDEEPPEKVVRDSKWKRNSMVIFTFYHFRLLHYLDIYRDYS